MTVSGMTQNKTRDMVYIAMFTVIIAICSWISIPSTVPFTLQTMGVFLAVGVMGGKRGSIAVLIYLLLGIFGLPVFAGFTGGLGIILSNRGGYIIGFLFTSLVMWGIEKVMGNKTWVLTLSMILGLLVCYAFGTAWFMTVYTNNVGKIGLWTALGWCIFPFIIPDMLKITLALLICKRLGRIVRFH